jgi:hypothetical protein
LTRRLCQIASPISCACWKACEEDVSIITTRRQDDLYLVQLLSATGNISALVGSPRSEGRRIFSDAEREVIARRKAQELALEFADAITDFESGRGQAD